MELRVLHRQGKLQQCCTPSLVLTFYFRDRVLISCLGWSWTHSVACSPLPERTQTGRNFICSCFQRIKSIKSGKAEHSRPVPFMASKKQKRFIRRARTRYSHHFPDSSDLVFFSLELSYFIAPLQCHPIPQDIRALTREEFWLSDLFWRRPPRHPEVSQQSPHVPQSNWVDN